MSCLKNWKGANLFLSKTIILFIFFCLPQLGNAQNLTYKGRVYASDAQPLEFANVVALSLPDSSIVNGTFTDHNGNFTLSLDSLNRNILFRVSLISYKTKIVNTNQLDSIVLSDFSSQLAEIVVKGHKKPFAVKNNTLICNVSGTSLSAETKINDIIGKLPGFYMQGDELKSINQGSIKWFINNRPATAEEISRLDIKSIKSIALDQHPGSRYGGEVGSVIFIQTNQLFEGISSFIRSYTRINHRLTQGLDGEIRYRYKNFSVTLGTDYTMSQSRPQEDNSFELVSSPSRWKVRSFDKKLKNRDIDQSYCINLAYAIKDKHQFNLRYTKSPSRSFVYMIGDLSLWKTSEDIKENFESKHNSVNSEDNVNFYYKGEVSKHWAFELSSDWYQKNNVANQDLQEKERLTQIHSTNNSLVWGLSPRVIYKNKQFQLQTGVDLSSSSIKGSTTLNINDALPTKNKIKEIKAAGYIGLDWQMLDDKLNIGCGLRYERTNKEYEDNIDATKSKSYFYHTLLPNLALSYTWGNWSCQLAYNSSIVYPSFNQLSGGEQYLNKYNIKISNPKLERAVIHKISYDCTYRWLYLTLGYNYTYRPIMETFGLDTFNDEYRIKVSPKNLSSMQGVNAIANIAPRFGFYEPRFMVGYIQNFMTLPQDNGAASRFISKPFMILALNNSFVLPHKWIVNLDYTYNGAGSNGYIEYSSSSSLNFSINKSFFNNKLQATLRFIDVLNTSTSHISGRFQGVLLNGYTFMDTRSARLSIIWYFNKHQSTKTHSSISSEVNRL